MTFTKPIGRRLHRKEATLFQLPPITILIFTIVTSNFITATRCEIINYCQQPTIFHYIGRSPLDSSSKPRTILYNSNIETSAFLSV
jgi:hypothetical protein